MSQSLSKQEKMQIVSNFILLSPPGEFNEVFNDVRGLLRDDNLLKEEVGLATAQYNKEQFIPCEIEGSDKKVLITEHGDKGGGKFYDPHTKQTFKYDHLRKVTSDVKSDKSDRASEPWRSSLETAFFTYAQNHFSKGTTSVYGSSSSDGTITLISCTESHEFNAKNFWNGRWRSQWSTSFQPSQKTAELSGILKLQVHYYEEGNVQLVSSKEVKETLNITNEADTAEAFCQLVLQAENEFQTATTENYQTMSNTTFKALRRALPITKAKIDWAKIAGFNIGKELKKTA